MATRIKLKSSITPNSTPTTSDLVDKEVAINIADKKLFVNNSGSIVEIGNAAPNTASVTASMLASDITNGPSNHLFVAKTGTDAAALLGGANRGRHSSTPFLTIKYALAAATSGDTVNIAAGEYQEEFPLTVPDGVTVRGAGLRSTQIYPTTATNDLNCFVLNGDTTVCELTVKDMFYNSSNDTGYAFVAANDWNSERSAYVQRVTVLNKGSTTSASDPYGFDAGDAGRGAKLDGAIANANTLETSVLFNEATFIVPNSVGILLTNGVRCEWQNSFIYFANEGIKGIQGATGKHGTGQARLKLSGVTGSFDASEEIYELENQFRSGTYALSSNVVTVTRTAHGLSTNDRVYCDFISGSATDGYYQVTGAPTADTFTFALTAGNTSGNVTYKKAVGYGAITSNDGSYIYLNGKGEGQFTTALEEGKTLTPQADARLDTSIKKFGTASLELDGTGDFVSIETVEDFGFGTANFAVEAWIYATSTTGTSTIFDFRTGSDTDEAPRVYQTGGVLKFASANVEHLSGGSLSLNTWQHVALARYNGTTRLYLDGSSVTGAGGDTDNRNYGNTKPLNIGSNYGSVGGDFFTGKIDEVRVSHGTARFTSNFTPPSAEYGTDVNTVLLIHFNGTDQASTFTDTPSPKDVRSTGGDSATGIALVDYSAFGCELKSIASANIYGVKGAVSDGNGCKLILSAHNFMYIGSGKDFTNDTSLANQANEVVETNGGRVFYSSTDQKGDFRVGEVFLVDQETGNVNFQSTSSTQQATSIGLSDSTGTTNIYPAYIETGNIRLAGNTFSTTSGALLIDPAGNEDITFNGEVIFNENAYFDINKVGSFNTAETGSIDINLGGIQRRGGFNAYGLLSDTNLLISTEKLSTITVNNTGDGYTGGSQTLTLDTNPAVNGQASCTIDTTDGSIKTVTVTNPGQLYTAPPDIGFNPQGTTNADATAVLEQYGIINRIDLADGGSGYTGTPTVEIEEPNTFSFSTGDDISGSTITIPDNPFTNGLRVVYTQNGGTENIGLSEGTTYYIVNKSGNNFGVSASQGGSAISLTASTSETPESHSFKGVNAAATVTESGGSITGITVTEPGTLYDGNSLPSITLSEDPGATAAAFTVYCGRSINNIAINGRGSGYSSPPTVSVTNSTVDTTGSGGQASATIGFPVNSVTITNVGAGYNFEPTILIQGGNPITDAVMQPKFSKRNARLTEIEITGNGVGYDTAPTLTLIGGAGGDAQTSVNIQSLTGNITNNGSGYTQGTYQGVSFSFVSGGAAPSSAATADFTVPGWTANITNAGSGYTDGQYDNITAYNIPVQTYTVTVISNPGTPPPDDVFVINGSTQASLTMVEGNTYRFDQSDSSNSGHPLLMGREDGGTLSSDVISIPVGTPGTAGAFTDVVLKPGTAGETADYICSSHAGMGAGVTITSGSSGNYGAGLSIDVTIEGGVVTVVKSNSQGEDYSVGDTFSGTQTEMGGAGSGFVGQLAAEILNIATVENISLTGGPYNVGDILSVDPGDVGGTGSNFQYTVTKVGFIRDVSVSDGGFGYNVGQTLIPRVSGNESGPSTTGNPFQLTVGAVTSSDRFEFTHDGAIKSDAFKLAGTKDPTLYEGSISVGKSATVFQVEGEFGHIITAGNITADGDLTVKGNMTLGDDATVDTITVSAAQTVTGDTTQTGNFALTGDFTQDTGNVTLTNSTISLADGTAAAPSLNFVTSQTTGFFHKNPDEFGIAIAGVEKAIYGTSFNIGNDFQVGVDSTTANPVLKVDVANATIITGTSQKGLQINNDASISAIGTDADVDITFTPKGNGGVTFTGSSDRKFLIKNGSTNVLSVDMATGDLESTGYLQSGGRLKITDSTLQNTAAGVTKSFGEILTLDTSGTGTTFTDGTFTGVAITSTGTGKGTGGTVDVTVVSSAITSVVVNAGGRDYVKGDQIVLDAAVIGTDLVQTVTITDVAGTGIVLKPQVARNILCDTTGTFVVPVGDTNNRPAADDTYLGGIRYNTTTSQFEGYNGIDYVSLGGVRDVDQDTYILTEVSPGSDEDTFEFYAQGINNLSLDKDKFTVRTAKLIDVEGTLTLNGTVGQDTLNVQRKGTSLFKVRGSKDAEITGGFFMKHQLVSGTIATFDDGTLGANAGTFNATAAAYDVSSSFTGVAGTSEFAGVGATFDIATDANGTITTITINTGGSNFEIDEVITIGGGLLGGAAGTDVTFTVRTLSNPDVAHGKISALQSELRFNMNGDKQFLSLDSSAAKAGLKVNRNYEAGGNANYLTVLDSTATFVELDSARVEGGVISQFTTNTSIVQFDKTVYKGGKTLITLESNDGKVHMFEVTSICGAAGTVAHATITNSITSDNDLMDAAVSVNADDVTISLAKSSQASSSTTFTGRFTTTKVKV